MSTIFLINTVLGLFGFCVCCLTTSVVYAPVYTVDSINFIYFFKFVVVGACAMVDRRG